MWLKRHIHPKNQKNIIAAAEIIISHCARFMDTYGERRRRKSKIYLIYTLRLKWV